MSSPVTVRVRDCACPDTPHPDGDEVYLPGAPSFRLGRAWERVFASGAGRTVSEVEDDLLEVYVRFGPTDWNLTDEAGEPVPFDPDVLLADWRMARYVADRADDLYSADLIRPFLNAPRSRSPSGPNATSTSPTRPRTQKRSRRSSRATSEATTP